MNSSINVKLITKSIISKPNIIGFKSKQKAIDGAETLWPRDVIIQEMNYKQDNFQEISKKHNFDIFFIEEIHDLEDILVLKGEIEKL